MSYGIVEPCKGFFQLACLLGIMITVIFCMHVNSSKVFFIDEDSFNQKLSVYNEESYTSGDNFEPEIASIPAADKLKPEVVSNDVITVKTGDQPSVIRDVHSCVAALKMSEFYDAAEDSMKYPPITSDTVTVPFFVFPELMPKPPATLYSCHTPTGNVKKSEWSPHAIRAIESHEWRVHSPDEALLFVIPLFDFIKKKGEKRCSSSVSYKDNDAFRRIMEVLDSYIEYLNPKNVVLLEGGYRTVMKRAAHLAESLVELEKTNRVMTETEKVWFNIQTYVFTQVGCAIKRFQGIRPMSINVDNTMFSPHADEDIRKIGDSLKEKIEKEMKLGYSGWSKRLLNIQSFGQFDSRPAYLNRKYIVREMEQLQIEGSLPSSFDPSLILYTSSRAKKKNA